jgi:hypothetical protein
LSALYSKKTIIQEDKMPKIDTTGLLTVKEEHRKRAEAIEDSIKTALNNVIQGMKFERVYLTEHTDTRFSLNIIGDFSV